MLGTTADPFNHPNGVGPGTDILLATLTFEAFAPGTTEISLSISGDENEGFALGDFSGLDSVILPTGTITIPQPSTFVLLALGCVAALKRRL